MARPRGSLKTWGAIVLAVVMAVTAGFIWLASLRNPSGNKATQAPPSSWSDTTRIEMPEVWDDMSWGDIPAATSYASANASRRQKILQTITLCTNYPAHYLRGLLLLGQEDPTSALLEFNGIPPEIIPPAHLYAPYRVQGQVEPSQPNPFLPPLKQAIARHQVEPLIQARVQAREGLLSDALQSYAQTDPARWKNLDIVSLQSIHHHAGLRSETETLVRGALRSGRLPENIASRLIQLASAQPNTGPAPGFPSRLRDYLASNEKVRELATAATIRHLEMRRQFVNREYATLLANHEETDPRSATDEAVILLLLASARQDDGSALDVWSQEIKRRFSTPEVVQWVEQIKSARP